MLENASVYIGDTLCATLPNDTSNAASETIDGVDDWFTVNCPAGVTGSFIKVKGFGSQALSFANILVFEGEKGNNDGNNNNSGPKMDLQKL
jgi:hypothetical protein